MQIVYARTSYNKR